MKQYPKKLSAVEILKLGKVIKKKLSTIVETHKFDIEHNEWRLMPTEIEFRIDKKPLLLGDSLIKVLAKSLIGHYQNQPNT